MRSRAVRAETPKRVTLVSRAARHGRQRLDALLAAGCTVVERFDLDNVDDPDTLAEGLAGSWATVAGHETYARPVLERLPELRAIARPGVGYEKVDVAAASSRGVVVLVAPGANADAVADHTLALMLACLKDLPRSDAAVRAGDWRPGRLPGDLTGATVGIVGLGEIGRRVARRLAAFECQILAVEPDAEASALRAQGIEKVLLPELLRRSAVVTLHVPATSATRHLIGRQELELMDRGAVIINSSRGAVVDETALVEALVANRIRGAGLDVFEREPLPAGSLLAQLDNVVLTGHVAGLSSGAAARAIDAVTSALVEIAAGRLPGRGVVNPEAWERAGSPS